MFDSIDELAETLKSNYDSGLTGEFYYHPEDREKIPAYFFALIEICGIKDKPIIWMRRETLLIMGEITQLFKDETPESSCLVLGDSNVF